MRSQMTDSVLTGLSAMLAATAAENHRAGGGYDGYRPI